MRILHVGKYYPPVKGGMETVLRDLAEGCLDHGAEVRVVTAGDGPEERTEVIRGPRTGRPGRLVRMAVPGVLNSQPLTLGVASVLRREIVSFRPDLVHLHLPNPLIAAAWLALVALPGLSLPPLVVWYHADITRQRLGRLMAGPVVGACLSRAAGVMVSSLDLATTSGPLAAVAERVRVIPFGIDPDPWLGLEAGQGDHLLFVGRLVPYKGVDVLLAAVARLPNAHLTVVGEGPERQALEELATRSGVGERVRFTGEIPDPSLAREMTDSLVLVLPSLDRSETFGLVQLEGMASGLAVVATELATGVNEVGRAGETGLTVPPGDPVALANALGSLLADPARARAMGEAGRRRFLEHFTRDVMVVRVLAAYDEFLQGEGCP